MKEIQNQQIQQSAQTGVHPVQVEAIHMGKPAESVKQKLEISALNTTLIGDYIAAVFPEHQHKWLVPSQGNATFPSTLDMINQGLVTVD